MLEAISSPISLATFPSTTSLTQIARWWHNYAKFRGRISGIRCDVGNQSDTADVERYYAANKAGFTDPEEIRAEYLVLDNASVAAGIA